MDRHEKVAAVVMAICVGTILAIGFGCGPMGKAMGRDFGACELGKLPGAVQSVLVDASTILVAGGSGWQQSLEGLSAQAGVDAVTCAVHAIAAGLSARMPAHGEPDPARLAALSRAQLWLSQHGVK